MPSEYGLQIEDFSGETTRTSITIAQLTPANVAAQQVLLSTLLSAIQGITLGAVRQDTLIYDRGAVDSSAVTDALAQREIKWLVRYHDVTTGKNYRLEIGTADLAGNLVTGTDLANDADTQIAAFITAFEAVAADPDTGLNDVEIDTIQFVGRNT